MRPGGPTCTPHQCNNLPLLVDITDRNLYLLTVTIACDQTITMVDLNQITVSVAIASESHHAGRHCDNIASVLASQIDPGVPGTLPGERI